MSEAKVEQQPGAFDMGVKRLYMRGAKISVTCAVCGEVYEDNVGDVAIYYPTANKEFEYISCHSEAEHETKVRLKIAVGLEVCRG